MLGNRAFQVRLVKQDAASASSGLEESPIDPYLVNYVVERQARNIAVCVAGVFISKRIVDTATSIALAHFQAKIRAAADLAYWAAQEAAQQAAKK